MTDFSDNHEGLGHRHLPPSRFLDEIQQSLRRLQENGCKAIPISENNLRILAGWGKEPPSKTLSGPRRETLEDILRDMGDCRRCRLHEKRRNIVFGAGDPAARLMFVGEGPGKDEDQQGIPFVGEAGQLLTRIIQAMGLTREKVYICNVVKCRPPENRNPEPDEIESCSRFLTRQIQSIQPAFICTLGKFSTQLLLNNKAPISRLRGRFYDYQGIRLIPTFHPAYLLRNPEKKREVWEDIQMLMREYFQIHSV